MQNAKYAEITQVMWKKASVIFIIVSGSLFMIFTMALPAITYTKSSVKQSSVQNVNNDINNPAVDNLPGDLPPDDDAPVQLAMATGNPAPDVDTALNDIIPDDLTPAEYSILEPQQRIAIINQKIKRLSANREDIDAGIATSEANSNTELLKLLNKEKSLNSTLESFYLQEIEGIKQELNLQAAKSRLASNQNDENLAYILNTADWNYSVIMLLKNEIEKEYDNVQLSNISIEKLNKVNLALSVEGGENAPDRQEDADRQKEAIHQEDLRRKYEIERLVAEIASQNQNINNQSILNAKLSMEVSQMRAKLLEEELKKRTPKSRLSGSDLTFMEDLVTRNNAELVEQISVYEKNLSFCEQKLNEMNSNPGSLFNRNLNVENVATYKTCIQINQEALNLVEEFIFLNKFKKDLHSHTLRIAAKIVYHDELTAIKAELERTVPYLKDLANEKKVQLAIWKKSIKSAELKSFVAKDKQHAPTLNEQIKFYNNGITSFEKYLAINTDVITLAIQVLNEINQKLEGKKQS